jgi:hypothetical protein
MKQTVAGIVLAALFLAGIYLAPRYFPIPVPRGSATVAAVAPGFVGQKQFGPWILTCPPSQSTAQPSAGDANALGRCRTVIPFYDRTDRDRIVMAVAFRTLGKTNVLAMVVRFPPWANKGDDVVLKAGATGFKLPVYQCVSTICVAAVAIGPAAQKLMIAVKEVEILFPPGSDGKRHGVRMPTTDIPAAWAGLRKAQS